MRGRNVDGLRKRSGTHQVRHVFQRGAGVLSGNFDELGAVLRGAFGIRGIGITQHLCYLARSGLYLLAALFRATGAQLAETTE